MFFAVVFPIDLLPVFGPGLFDFVRFERVAWHDSKLLDDQWPNQWAGPTARSVEATSSCQIGTQRKFFFALIRLRSTSVDHYCNILSLTDETAVKSKLEAWRVANTKP
jgi:hypothetical protein